MQFCEKGQNFLLETCIYEKKKSVFMYMNCFYKQKGQVARFKSFQFLEGKAKLQDII